MKKTTKKSIGNYVIKVKGESESDWSGAVAENIEALIKKPSKDTATLLYNIVKTQIEMACQAGDTESAMTALEKYREQEFAYSAPMNVFKRDHQNGMAPYIGAHSFLGALRDAMGNLFNAYYKKKGDNKPSSQHLRKVVKITPHHIFLYRNGQKITEVDKIDGQQPIPPKVSGFARYEVIFHPFNFDFVIQVNCNGNLFKDVLSDPDKVVQALYQSTFHGAGGRRAAGYGAWKVVEAKVEDFRSIKA